MNIFLFLFWSSKKEKNFFKIKSIRKQRCSEVAAVRELRTKDERLGPRTETEEKIYPISYFEVCFFSKRGRGKNVSISRVRNKSSRYIFKKKLALFYKNTQTDGKEETIKYLHKKRNSICIVWQLHKLCFYDTFEQKNSSNCTLKLY